MADNIENLPFHRKYRPNTLKKYIGNEKLKATLMRSLNGATRPQVILLEGASGCGKAQPLTSLVLTTSGYKQMGEIAIGDEVFTGSGNIAKVSGVFPQGKRPIYRITLSDRTFIDVADNHLNSVYRYNSKKSVREDYVLNTEELISFLDTSSYKLRIDVPSVSWDTQDVPLDPYLVGALIGDGGLYNSLRFSNPEYDIVMKVHNCLLKYDMRLDYVEGTNCDYSIHSIYDSKYVFKYKDKVYYGCGQLQSKLESEGYPKFDPSTLRGLAENDAPNVLAQFPELLDAIDMQIIEEYRLNYFRDTVDSLGLNCKSTEKFIPKCYLYNDKETRIALLQGLFDTDGTISKNGLYEFSTSSKQLSDDFAFLVRSLGIRDTVATRKASYKDEFGNTIECCTNYRHYIKAPNSILCFSSEKHMAKWYQKQHDPIRNIESIELLGVNECQCIMVDHPDHTYISDFFIPTHNTTMARLLAKEYSCYNRDPEDGACGECASCQQMDEYIATGDTSTLTNVQEVDITDQSGKRDLDTILDDMAIPSFGGEWKIYIFDECHMATQALQNRLLKVAEEPPENVLMILCTTNPERIIETLLNRCQLKLKVTKPTVKDLAGLLKSICKTEGIEYDQQGLEFIANRGELTIRTALTNLQQIINEENSAKYEDAIKVFDEISSQIMINIFRALKNKDTLKYETLLYEAKSKVGVESFFESLKQFVLRGVYTINGIQQDGVSEAELKVYRDLFGDMGVVEIGSFIDRLLNIKFNNLDLELIALGYTDLTQRPETQGYSIEHLDNELKREENMADTVLREHEQEAFEAGIENATKQTESVGIDALLEMGGQLVTDS